MARRHHDAAVHLLGKGGEVDALGTAQPYVVHVDAGVQQSARERLAQLGARQPDVAADDHAFRLEEFRVGPPDPVSHIGIEFEGNAGAVVVRFEAGNRRELTVDG